MPRSFDGVDDKIKFAIGNAQAGGYGTLAAIVKRGADSVTQNIIIVENSTASAGVEWSIRNTGVLALWTGSVTRRTTTLTFTVADGWCLLVAKKDTGTQTARFGKYVFATDTWTWENAGDGTQGDWSTSLTTPDVVIGAYDGGAPGSFFTGDIAAVGIWGGSVLTDAEAQALPHSLDAWFQEQPTGLWLLDQAATTQKVNDHSGGGANESALTGTTVGTSSVPGFSYGAPIILQTQEAPAAGGSDVTVPVDISATPGGLLDVFLQPDSVYPAPDIAGAGLLDAALQADSVYLDGADVAATGLLDVSISFDAPVVVPSIVPAGVPVPRLAELRWTILRPGAEPLDATRLIVPERWSTLAVGGFGSLQAALPGDVRFWKARIPYLSIIRATLAGRVVWEGQVEDLGMAIRGGGEVGCRLRAFGLARKLDETSVRKQWLTRDLGTWNYVVQETSDISLLQGQLDQTDPTKVGVRFSVANGASLLGTRHSSIARVFAPAGLYWKQVAGTRAATLAFAATWALTMTSSSELTGTTAFTDTGSESATSFSATATSDTIDYMTFVLDGGASDWTAGTADYAEIYGLRLLGWGTAEDTSGAFYGGTILRDLIALVPGLAVGDIETGSDFGIQQIEAAVRRSARQLVDEIAGYYSREWAVWEDGRFDWKTPALDEPQWVTLLSDLDELDLEGTVDGIAKTTYVLYTDAAQQRDAEASATSTDQRNPYVKQDGTRDRLLSAGFPMTSASAAQLAAKYASEGGQWPQVRGTITVAADKLVEHARMGAQPAWTIRAGENIAIADLPKTDTLAAGRDGETHFHIVSADVDLKRRRVVLQVEAQTPRMDQLLARLSTATRAVTG